MQEISNKELKMSFKDYYEAVGNLKNELRNIIIGELEISVKTFYNKMTADSWSSLERAKIDELYKSHVNDLVSKLI